MSFVVTLVLVVQVLCALGVIVLVLLQHGKGADMGAAFGSGASGSLFGATGSANFLSRTTAVLAALFFVCTLGLAYLSNNRAPQGGSVIEQGAGRPASVLEAPGAGGAAAPSAGESKGEAKSDSKPPAPSEIPK